MALASKRAHNSVLFGGVVVMSVAGAARARGSIAALWRVFKNTQHSSGPGFGAALSAFLRMLPARMTGTYTGASLPRLAAMAAALGYILSPIDLMPEALLLVLGLADDALVLTWLVGAAVNEGERFWNWERTQKRAPRSHPDTRSTQSRETHIIDGELLRSDSTTQR